MQALHSETLLGDDGRWSIVRSVSRPTIVITVVVVGGGGVGVVALVVLCILLSGTTVCTTSFSVNLEVTRGRRFYLQFILYSSRDCHGGYVGMNKFTHFSTIKMINMNTVCIPGRSGLSWELSDAKFLTEVLPWFADDIRY